MKVVILGATGGTGQALVRQCLELHYTVTVFVRNPEKVSYLKNTVRIVVGDVREYAAVADAVKGQDAVLVALGVIPWHTENILSRGTEHIVRAMHTHNVSRLVCETGAGLMENKANLPILWRVVASFPPMQSMYEGKRKQEYIIRKSSLEWVLVRPSNLTNGPRTKSYQFGETIQLKINSVVSRADVADCMLTQLTDNQWLHKACTITY